MKSKILEPGQKFNRLTVIKLDHIETKIRKSVSHKNYNRNFEYYLCKCDCGKETIVEKSLLILNYTKSCGCLIKEKAKQLQKFNIKHNLSRSRIYHIWQGIKQRCFDINDKHYKDYGGRGIKICEEWENDFMSFYNWAINNGYKENLSIDRIDVNGNYEPSNCRWVDIFIQANNKRNSIFIKYNNKIYTSNEFVKLKQIPRTTLLRKIKKIDNLYYFKDKEEEQ